MGMGGQKPLQLQTINLLTSPPDPRELSRPPPEIRLPPNACLSPNPAANADPSYLRCTLNAIPTTSNLLNKCKIPLGLVITPYRSLNEGESAVPLVTDTIIARCRRCRTYINPFVQFIDGGNRYVDSLSLSIIANDRVISVGDAACVTCLTKYPNCSTGIRSEINLVTGGHAMSLTTLPSSLLPLPSTWSEHLSRLCMLS
jgi:hypothetical protein